jgi:hypothetical protein
MSEKAKRPLIPSPSNRVPLTTRIDPPVTPPGITALPKSMRPLTTGRLKLGGERCEPDGAIDFGT